MTRRLLLAVAVAGALLLPTAPPTRAVGNPNEFVRLPFPEAECRVLINRGAPFQIGNPDTREGNCFVIINWRAGRVVLPFSPGECQSLINRGAPFQVGNPDEGGIIQPCIIVGRPPVLG